MKPPRRLCCALAFPLLLAGCASVPLPNPPAAQAKLPELALRDFFKRPVGPKGLEPTDTLLSLAGKKIRVAGHMVKEEEPTPGQFMLAPVPVSLAELADGPSDYLPPATLYVSLPAESAQKTIAYRPGVWALVGTLELGGREEANGRVSYARLRLDDAASISAPGQQAPAFQDAGAGHAHPH